MRQLHLNDKEHFSRNLKMNTNVSVPRLNQIHRVPQVISGLFCSLLFCFVLFCFLFCSVLFFTLLPVFPLPAEKLLSFPPSRWILHNLLPPRENFEK